MPRLSLVRTTSFRLAAIYLLLFTLSALALGAFVYLSVRREILADFDERIVEETDSLQRIFAREGRERLTEILRGARRFERRRAKLRAARTGTAGSWRAI